MLVHYVTIENHILPRLWFPLGICGMVAGLDGSESDQDKFLKGGIGWARAPCVAKAKNGAQVYFPRLSNRPKTFTKGPLGAWSILNL